MHRSKVIHLLNERLAFERAAGRLYDGVLERLRLRAGPYQAVQAHLRRIREEELAHAEWLEEQVRGLGGAPEPEGEGLLRVKAEVRRLEEALLSDQEPAQLFNRLLAVEVADIAGWELLLELAERAQDEEASAHFRQRLHEEQEHFLFISHIAAVFGGSDILDETVTTLEDASA